MSTATLPAPVHERGQRQGPVQQQLLRHDSSIGRTRRVKLKSNMSLPILDVNGLQRTHRPRLRGRLRREVPPRGPHPRPVARPRRHRKLARFQSYIAPEIPEYLPVELHRVHGLRHRVPGHRHPRQSARRGPSGTQKLEGDSRKSIARCSRPSGRKHQEVLRRRGEEERRASAACSTSSSTRRSARAAPSASPCATTTR